MPTDTVRLSLFAWGHTIIPCGSRECQNNQCTCMYPDAHGTICLLRDIFVGPFGMGVGWVLSGNEKKYSIIFKNTSLTTRHTMCSKYTTYQITAAETQSHTCNNIKVMNCNKKAVVGGAGFRSTSGISVRISYVR